ncbi:ABC transporter permease [Ruicaihuangia caeni]|uniref:ABC transporter permease n=1 Tax=Ruicaihuangia caeni TaxID=3042517 RepID=A0AAW6T5C7_9MICO|nr:ABC transporter permease [Klugiella sp. YN-L-19]MDI2097573.1 ABC transporter permease [Klugiella sp. YN-L-19]
MVAQLLGLRLSLLANALRRSPLGLAGLAIVVVYGIALLALALGGFALLRELPVDTAAAIATTAGALFTAAIFVLPLLVSGNDQFDPRRFVLFGLEPAALARGILLSSVLSLPVLGFIVIGIAHTVTFARDGVAGLFGVVALPALVATLALFGRLGISVGAALHSVLVARGVVRVITLVVLALIVPVLLRIADFDWARQGGELVAQIAAVLGWTPFGAAWAVGPLASEGDWWGALLRLLVAFVSVAVLFGSWSFAVERMLRAPALAGRREHHSSIGLFGLFGRGAAWAIAARSLTYWVRDPRYLTAIVVVPLIPLLMAVPLLIAGVPVDFIALLPVPVVALFIGWSVHNDVALDHSAVWLHLVADTRGFDDRVGRAVPPIIIGVPAVTLASLLCAGVYGDAAILPPMLGVGFAILGASIGVSSVASAALPYPTALPGESPFQQPSGGGGAVRQAVSFFATLLLAGPVFALAVASQLLGGQYVWLTLWCGVGLGLLCLVLGLHLGGKIFDRRGPELLAAALRG